jgi:putative membrane-bound dehydrogenase-like protein
MKAAARILGSLLPALLLVLAARPQGFTPDEAVRRMQVPDGFAVRLVAAEPLVRQPVALDFDDRGRLWVLQYLQYPNPAGLKRVKVDRYSRTVYDRVPEPPPRGPKGADRLTILEDTDGDGRADRARDFVAGLNLASGFALGHGGVFVLQAPYLLFYPDRDGDDVPDGDPEVLLSGFGMEDASAVANSLTWGPDGWLYGCQGSTVTANVRGIEFQQGVWRYHPVSKRFELFCEGGGNCWGLDFDRRGNLLVSTNVGGFVALHAVQGGYYWKAFGKHGPLHNPHAYGYFDHLPHAGFRGGHVTVGGIVYEGDSFPERFRGKYLAADLLGHAVYWHTLAPDGSSFRSAHGGELLLANDTWFAPTDLALGPEGAVYVADWYDRRTAHPDPDATWDRTNGRVYRIEARGTRPYPGGDLRKLSSAQLVGLLSHKNDWLVRKARRLLADRRDRTVIAPLRSLVLESNDDALALQALWALYVSGGWDESFAAAALSHKCPDVRRWAVRFLGDDSKVSAKLAAGLADLAKTEPDVSVRSQLASTARRLPPADGLPVVRALLLRDLDAKDPHLPLLLWWAVESQALADRERVLAMFTAPQMWKSALAREAVLGRLVRRYAAEGTEAGYEACVRLLLSAPTAADRGGLLAGLDQGLAEQKRLAPAPPDLAALLDGLAREAPSNRALLHIRVRLGRPGAEERALALAADTGASAEDRVDLIGLLGEAGSPACIGPLLKLVGAGPEGVRLAALAALGRFDQDAVADALLGQYPHLPDRGRARAASVLLGRRAWARRFLQAVDEGRIKASDVGVEDLRAVALLGDPLLDPLVRKHWGTVRAATPEEKLAEVRRLNNDLRAGTGDPRRGRDLFRKRCATCHALFGEGERLGPDLTTANRKDRDFLLVSLVDPSAVVRKEYLAHVLQTRDGRVLTGLLADQSPASVTLVDAKGQQTTVPRGSIDSLEESAVSLMPEGLLADLDPAALRDLFSYLQAEKPP